MKNLILEGFDQDILFFESWFRSWTYNRGTPNGMNLKLCENVANKI